MIDLNRSTRKTRHFQKDLRKAEVATKFIGRGSPSSSTHAYAIAAGDRANTGQYDERDIVMISAEGDRSNRQSPDFHEIELAPKARALILTDTPEHRDRAYNIGERQVATFLDRHGYREWQPGSWSPRSA